MSDRHRWFWAIARAADRSRWATFAGFALASTVVLTAVFLIVYLSEPTQTRQWGDDFFLPLGMATALMILFWLGMAIASYLAARRPGSPTLEEHLEMTAGPHIRPMDWLQPPSLRSTAVVAAIVGALAFVASRRYLFASLAAADVTTLLLLMRWAWPGAQPPRWKLLAVAVYAGATLAAFERFTPTFGDAVSSLAALRDGLLVTVVVLAAGMWVRRLMSPQGRPRLALALHVRDEALALARDGKVDHEPARLLAVANWRRYPLEAARSLLNRRGSDEQARRAVALIDRTIDAGGWGTWPWSRAGPSA